MIDASAVAAELGISRLRELFRYEPESGAFVRLVDCGKTGKAGQRAGSVNAYGYRYIKINRKCYRTARLAVLYMTGLWPAAEVDHINRVRDDDRWCNLRESTRSANLRNRRLPSSKVVGVSQVRGKWRASISRDGRSVHLGMFDSPEDAHAAYLEAAKC